VESKLHQLVCDGAVLLPEAQEAIEVHETAGGCQRWRVDRFSAFCWQEIFAANPRDLHAGEGNEILGPVMGEHSVLLTDEAEHARARRLLMPAFNGASLHGYRSLVASLARAEIDRWKPNTELRALDRMNALTLEVIMRVVFGARSIELSRVAMVRLRRAACATSMRSNGSRCSHGSRPAKIASAESIGSSVAVMSAMM
jgi:hypothetical protein